GRHERRRNGEGGPSFASLLQRLAAIPGLRRIRYTSPHPIFFDDDLIALHGELEALCPHVHLPVQSGSDAVLAAMRRRYGADDLRRLVERLRAARPDLALTTDLIVGSPGESEADCEATLALIRELGFADAYSFKYSPRPGTAAADRSGSVPEAVAQDRLEALQALQRGLTLAYHRSRVGGSTEILVEGASSRSGREGRGGQLSGRDPWHRVVNLPAEAFPGARAGDLIPVRIAEATPHSLIAEAL